MSTLIYSAQNISVSLCPAVFSGHALQASQFLISVQLKDTKYIHLLNSVLRLRSTLIAEFVRISSLFTARTLKNVIELAQGANTP